MNNPLGQMMGQGPSPDQGPQAGGPPQPRTDPMAQLSASHDAAKASYQKTSEVGTLLKATRGELDKLVALGPSVTVEDVMKGAGQILAAGGDESQLLNMIANPQSPMPQGGEALASWVKTQDQMVAQREAQFGPAETAASHQLGTSALRNLHGMDVKGQSMASPVPQPNAASPPPQGS